MGTNRPSIVGKQTLLCQPLVSVCPSQLDATGRANELFHYFRTQVVAQIAGEFDKDFWNIHALQAVQAQPILWHASNAIAAIHRRHRISTILAGSLVEKDKPLHVHALHSYNASLKNIMTTTRQRSISPQEQEAIVIANILFVVLAWLRRDIPECFVHLSNGRRILWAFKLWDRTRLHRSHEQDILHPSDSICLTFLRLESLLMNMRQRTYVDESYWPGLKLPLRDIPFISLTEAYLELEIIWNVANDVTFIVTPPDDRDLPPREAIRETFRVRLKKWEEKFEELILSKTLQKCDEAAIMAFKLRVTHLNLILAIELADLEVCWDKFEARFETLIALAQNLLNLQDNLRRGNGLVITASNQPPGTITITPFVNESLYMVAWRCRRPTLRRKAVMLLDHNFSRSAAIDTAMYICMARIIIAIEEAAWSPLSQKNEAINCSCVCGVQICNGHRVTTTTMNYPFEGMAELEATTINDQKSGNLGKKIPMPYGLYRGTHVLPTKNKPS